jgi:hypothetical protein
MLNAQLSLFGTIFGCLMGATLICWITHLVAKNTGSTRLAREAELGTFAMLIGSPLIMILMSGVLLETHDLLELMSSPFTIAPALLLCLMFYYLRSRRPLAYGLLEIWAGILTLSFAIFSPAQNALLKGLGLLGGVYIVVRGLDNVDRGLPAGLRRYWDKAFPKSNNPARSYWHAMLAWACRLLF